jgi:Multiubiquitin
MNATVEGSATKKITIKIDKETFHVDRSSMTGHELRALENPPIGPERDLFLVVPGPSEDRKIADEEVVELKSGMHFFTAPTTITPGVDAPAG